MLQPGKLPYTKLNRTRLVPSGLGQIVDVDGVTSWWLSGGIPAANCIAVYQPKGAASYAASKINLANPGTYDATEGVAPSWAAETGWTGNGSTMFLITGLANSGYSIVFRYSGASLNFRYFYGNTPTTGSYRAAWNYLYFGNKSGVLGSHASGVYVISKSGTTVRAYYNGNAVPELTLTAVTFTPTADITQIFFDGAIYGNMAIQMMAFYDIALDTYQAALAAAMAAL